MNTILQRVSRASVKVRGEVVGRIERGALLLVGVERGDAAADADATARKIARLRFFPGATPMDRNLVEVGGACLVVSQFTLAADLRKGNRPGFGGAMDPDLAERLYRRVVTALEGHGVPCATGTFGAHMDVELVNDGPITLLVFTADGRVL
jgi:D-tyrosyl-tRNA(Tyr) deacylase